MNTNNVAVIVLGGAFNYTTKDNKKGVFYELCILTEKGMRIYKATPNVYAVYMENCDVERHLAVSGYYFDEYGRIANVVIHKN